MADTELTSATILPADPALPTAVVWPSRPRIGLSWRLLLVTVVFVAICEVLVYVPAVANYRLSWLSDRIAAAQIAALVLDAAPTHVVSEDLAARLLAGVGARAIVVRDGETSTLLSIEPMPTAVAETLDLRTSTWWRSLGGTWRTLSAPSDVPIRVIGPGKEGYDFVEMLVSEAPLHAAVMEFSTRLLLSSLAVAAAAAGLVFVALQYVIVHPVRRLANNITAFSEAPEEAARIVRPSSRSDEIGDAEIALARMQRALAGELREKRRLAELGLSVSKINHELRNLLAAAQLLGDRLGDPSDPNAQRVAPRLVATLGRAVRFCEATLAYGRATERHPQRRLTVLAPILAELPDIAGLATSTRVAVRIQAPSGLQVCADPDQLARALANLVRNAVQALDTALPPVAAPEVTVFAVREGGVGSGQVTIVVRDNGPGLSRRAKEHLFSPFQGCGRAGGAGLGLAIAHELVTLNGGTLTLDESQKGACFRIALPDRIAEAVREG
ncbi:ATP-binding protein [Methylobacterium sp. sgz302541]|uniref:ATP-binding protein n=1 Tax=unclassified Methylobacterium TaxID=2615210 RepID=UPI003D346D4A